MKCLSHNIALISVSIQAKVNHDFFRFLSKSLNQRSNASSRGALSYTPYQDKPQFSVVCAPHHGMSDKPSFFKPRFILVDVVFVQANTQVRFC